MSYFVIIGIPLCPFTNHAKYVAEFLSKSLPNFTIHYQEKTSKEWKKWLKAKNLCNGWYHEGSPIIWKELTMRGGEPHYIGGLNEFWVYCYDYYKLESILSFEELDKLVGDYKQYYESKIGQETIFPTPMPNRIICIAGDELDLVTLIITNLLVLNEAFINFNVIIRVFQQSNYHMSWQVNLANISDIPFQIKYSIEVITSLKPGLLDCDLLIVTGDYSRSPNESLHKWLLRNYVSMIDLSYEINLYAERSLRIIVATSGPICFNATVLLRNVTQLRLHNIVALTADLGLEVLDFAAKLLDAPLKNLGAPPVWGFCGINQIIDIEHIIERSDVYRPNLRGVKYINDTTLTIGKNYTELRYFNYRTFDVIEFWTSFENNKMKNEDGGNIKNMFLPKIRALASLVDNWFSSSKDGNIISLGFVTNGTFGLPSGIIFSQPVIVKHGRWYAMETFPIPRKNPCGVTDLIPCVVEILLIFHMIYVTKHTRPS